MELLALLEAVTRCINHALWGVPMVLLLLVTHLYMTCRTWIHPAQGTDGNPAVTDAGTRGGAISAPLLP